MYTLAFMFKPSLRVERLGPQEILFILQSQAGSAALKLYLSDGFSDFFKSACGGDPKTFLDSLP